MPDLSLLLPTRERLPQLRRALESAVATADRPERLEVVLSLDEDDEPSHGFTFPELRIVKLIRPRTRLGRITNACFEASGGRYLMLANDDIVFRTPGWDSAVQEAFREYEDDVALVWGNDLYSGGPAHPFLSRTMCEITGHVCPDAYHHEYIDVHIYDLFRRLQGLGYNRMRYLDGTIIEHMHVFAGKADPDQVYVKDHCHDDELTYIAWAEERELSAWGLKQHIDAAADRRNGDRRRASAA